MQAKFSCEPLENEVVAISASDRIDEVQVVKPYLLFPTSSQRQLISVVMEWILVHEAESKFQNRSDRMQRGFELLGCRLRKEGRSCSEVFTSAERIVVSSVVFEFAPQS